MVRVEEESGGEMEQAGSVSGVIVIPDSPVSEEEQGGRLEAVLGQVVEPEDTENDSIDEGLPVVTAQVIPALPGSMVCKLAGCLLPVYVSREGERFGYCCRSHVVRDKRPGEALMSALALCKLPGCDERVFVDQDGSAFEFCCRSHGREFAARAAESRGAGSSGGVVMDQGGPGNEGQEDNGEPSEFSDQHGLICVRLGCLRPVKAPHMGVPGGRMGRGPTRYNFCCRPCKALLGTGENSVPYSTTLPLRRAWYRDQMDSALQEWQRVMEQSSEDGRPEGAASSNDGDASARVSPLPI
mmetsp:Transcript_61485/g.127004  ORF Transcript_61485/g.127004 Transcript_61485/m.127004 type:complete len:298 (+) Transcript_61485:1450-2343(+)